MAKKPKQIISRIILKKIVEKVKPENELFSWSY